MIFDLLISIITGIVNFFLNLLPTSSLPTEVTEGFQTFMASAWQFNTVFPIDTLFTLLGITIGIMSIIFLWRGINYVISLVRGN